MCGANNDILEIGNDKQSPECDAMCMGLTSAYGGASHGYKYGRKVAHTAGYIPSHSIHILGFFFRRNIFLAVSFAISCVVSFVVFHVVALVVCLVVYVAVSLGVVCGNVRVYLILSPVASLAVISLAVSLS